MKLYHVSQEPDIREFIPRPAPAHFTRITAPVVFAITDTMLHNYLMPRDCPRVTYYPSAMTTHDDYRKFFGETDAPRSRILLEERWRPALQETTLYLYEFSAESFELLDDTAGCYISNTSHIPQSVTVIEDCLSELARRKVDLQFVENLWEIADAVAQSSLNYSIIRMRNALPRE